MTIPSVQLVKFAADMRKVVPGAPTTLQREADNLRRLDRFQRQDAEEGHYLNPRNAEPVDKAETPVGTHAIAVGERRERTLTFNFTITEWRSLVASAAMGSIGIDPGRPELRATVNRLCQQIAESTGAFDAVGRERRQ